MFNITKILSKFKSKKVKVNNQKDLSLGYIHISFDASVMPNGHVGIGMHDITNCVRKHSGGKVGGFSSSKGEMAALMFTLDYARENKLSRLNLYTDNLDLATKGIKKLLQSYNFEDVHLTWVPRELNTSADKLSKEGQKLNKTINPIFVGPSANQTKKKKTQTKNRKPVAPLKSDGSLNSLTVFSKYSMKQKVQILSSLSKKEDNHEQEFIRMLKDQKKSDYKFNISNANVIFFRMAKTLLMNDPETSDYVKSRFKKMKNPANNQGIQGLSFQIFEREFDKRKPVMTIKSKPEPRSSYMIEMVQTLKAA